MASKYLQQEILVVTSSLTCQDAYSNITPEADMSADNTKEHLEEASWDGLLDHMLPLTIRYGEDQNKLYLWQLFIGNQTVCAELSEGPFNHDIFHTLNPFVFLTCCNYC